MLHFPEQPSPLLPDAVGPSPARLRGTPAAGGKPSDAAIDAALCRVVLPEDLLSRLTATFAALTAGASESDD